MSRRIYVVERRDISGGWAPILRTNTASKRTTSTALDAMTAGMSDQDRADWFRITAYVPEKRESGKGKWKRRGVK